MQINHAILAHIDGIEEVLNDGVGGRLLSSELVGLADKLAEIGERDATILLLVELITVKTGQNKSIVVLQTSSQNSNSSPAQNGNTAFKKSETVGCE